LQFSWPILNLSILQHPTKGRSKKSSAAAQFAVGVAFWQASPCGRVLVVFPVPTKSVPRWGSIACGCQTAPPLYPPGFPPLSGMSKSSIDSHRFFTSSATTLPTKAAARICGIMLRTFFSRKRLQRNNACQKPRDHYDLPPDDLSTFVIHRCS